MRKTMSLIIAAIAIIALVLARDIRREEVAHELYQQLAVSDYCTVYGDGVAITTSVTEANRLLSIDNARAVYYVDCNGKISQLLDDGNMLTVLGSENW